MTRSCLFLLISAGALGCGAPDAPSGADARPRSDAHPAPACRTEVMENVIAEREIREGDFCDDVQLCARDADAAASITAIAPEFSCDPAPGGCSAGEIPCVWRRPHVLDEAEYQKLCAISSLEDPPLMRCWVYLGLQT